MADLRINGVGLTSSIGAAKPAKNTGNGFADLIKEAINRVNRTDLAADQAVADLFKGKTTTTDAMLALQNADISLRMTMAVRNKVIDAYREIMRMQF